MTTNTDANPDAATRPQSDDQPATPAPAAPPTAPAAVAAVGPLATTVVGSYSVPEWLERLKTDYYQRRISGAYLDEIHEVAIKAALKDQERAGVEIVSDGELRRDNDIDYFLARIPGVEIPHRAKAYYYDYYDAVVTHPLPVQEEGGPPPLGLVAEYRFTQACTDRPVKCSVTGPFSLARRLRREGGVYAGADGEAELVLALAQVLNREVRALAEAGAAVVQVDEPYLAGSPEQVALAVRALNGVFAGVAPERTRRAVHVCYGNRYARPLWEGHYDFLFPALLEAAVDQVLLEFARKGYDDLALFQRYPEAPFRLGLGVIDVKSTAVEPATVVAARIRRALQVLPPERLLVNPDCGLRHLPADVARAKLHALTAGAAIVRADLFGTPPPDTGGSGADSQ